MNTVVKLVFGLKNALRLLAITSMFGLMSPLAHATTDQIFSASDSSVGESGTIDLNSYSVSTISNIYLSAEGSGASESPDDWVYAAASISLDPADASGFDDYDDQWGLGNAYVAFYTVVTNITKNEEGHWIAESVATPDGTYYNVDLGTGIIYVAGGAAGTGYGGGSTSCTVVY